MRKFYFSCIAVMLTMVLLGCSFSEMTYPLSQSTEDIAKIEIVEVSDYRLINTGNFDMITTIQAIDATCFEEFLNAFFELRCNKSPGVSQEVLEGKAIRFTYNNGAFEIVGVETAFYCDADKNRSYPAYYFDFDTFDTFIRENS